MSLQITSKKYIVVQTCYIVFIFLELQTVFATSPLLLSSDHNH